MSQLMRKLDRLNLDIEEALSASSSPSGTPCTPRKKQVSVRKGHLAPKLKLHPATEGLVVFSLRYYTMCLMKFNTICPNYPN